MKRPTSEIAFIGFAIPSNFARPVMQSIIKDGHVELETPVSAHV